MSTPLVPAGHDHSCSDIMLNVPSSTELSEHSGSGSGNFEGGSGCKLFSIRFVFASIFSISIVMAVACTSLLMIKTYTEAVDDTKKNGEDATAQCFQQAEISLDTVASDLLMYSMEAVAGQIQNSFDLGWKHLQALDAITKTYPIPENGTAWFDNPHVKHSLWQQLEFFRWPDDELPFITAIGVYIQDDFLSNMIYGGNQMGLHVVGNWSFMYPLLYAGEFASTGYAMNFVNNDSAALVAARIPNVWPPGAYRWASLEKVNTFVGYTMVSQATVNGKHLNVMCSMTLQSLSKFMENLVKTSRQMSGSESRMYTVVARSWIKDRKKEIWDNYTASPDYPYPAAAHAQMEIDYGDWWKFDQEHLLTSVSDGDVISDPSAANPFLSDVEATDDVIHAVAVAIQAFPNKYNGIHELGHASKVNVIRVNQTDNTTYGEIFFVQVTPVKNKYGIDWWLTTAIDEKYVYGDVTAKQIELQLEIAMKTNDVEDTVSEKRTETLVIVAVIGIGLTLVSLVCGHVTMIPLRRLSLDMNDVAVMKLDRVSTFTHLSSLREIRLMQQHFHKMVQNLMEYRAYVPNAVIRQEVLVDPPNTPNVAIVFTDIEGSTALWNFNPGAMNHALEIHNNVMRQAAIRHLGYEVKTIGDAFMMAFEKPLNAVEFGLTVQQNLRTAEWPTDLCFDQDGLRVRIGCHYGEVVREENPMTGRTDYRGTTVNTASRLEGKAKGCTVCITSELKELLSQEMDNMSSIKALPFGSHELKGLGTGHDLFLLAHKDVTITDRAKYKDISPTPAHLVGKEKYEKSSAGSSGSAGGVTLKSSGVGLSPGVKRHARKPTGLSLVSGTATVAICVLKSRHRNSLFDDFNLMVRFVAEASNTCDGVVGAVTGTSILISWNTSKVAKRHHFNAMNFAAVLERRASRIMTIGITTGVVLHGNIGTQKQRFPTVCGDPLECSKALADHAASMGAFCLIGDCTKDSKISEDKSFIRTVDAWLLKDKVDEQLIVIFELLAQKMVRKLEAEWTDATDDVAVSDMTIVDHEQSMANLLKGRTSAIDGLKKNQALNPSDVVLQNVISMFEEPIQADGARCEVQFTNVPHTAHSWLRPKAKKSPVPSPGTPFLQP
eukprot:TRINITY_DN6937_c0_g1_i1.p1 TRINITY_DN6937_c0_g1~~TRINITY_DN6937_c0_g1_i1.p1  ORF type:complete len:1113 (+),score=209.22 TRINITY_DN6937_c0_g1_i1:35-3373(+)